MLGEVGTLKIRARSNAFAASTSDAKYPRCTCVELFLRNSNMWSRTQGLLHNPQDRQEAKTELFATYRLAVPANLSMPLASLLQKRNSPEGAAPRESMQGIRQAMAKTNGGRAETHSIVSKAG